MFIPTLGGTEHPCVESLERPHNPVAFDDVQSNPLMRCAASVVSTECLPHNEQVRRTASHGAKEPANEPLGHFKYMLRCGASCARQGRLPSSYSTSSVRSLGGLMRADCSSYSYAACSPGREGADRMLRRVETWPESGRLGAASVCQVVAIASSRGRVGHVGNVGSCCNFDLAKRKDLATNRRNPNSI